MGIVINEETDLDQIEKALKDIKSSRVHSVEVRRRKAEEAFKRAHEAFLEASNQADQEISEMRQEVKDYVTQSRRAHYEDALKRLNDYVSDLKGMILKWPEMSCVNCSICMQTFPLHDTKTMSQVMFVAPCMHSCCYVCFFKMANVCNSGILFDCPFCRRQFCFPKEAHAPRANATWVTGEVLRQSPPRGSTTSTPNGSPGATMSEGDDENMWNL